MQINIYRCRICGEVYIGSTPPPLCPFCGVKQKYLVSGKVWQDENNIDLTDVSRQNLQKALELELSNALFYKCISETSTEPEIASMFKGLFKVEREHAAVFRKILKPQNEPNIEEKCGDDSLTSLSESLEREKRAIKFYGEALVQATEPRLKEVFEAIMQTEKDHLLLDNEMIEKMKGDNKK